MSRHATSTSTACETRRRLAFPLAADDEGRLLTASGEAAAVRQLLGLVRDLGPGEYPGVAGLFNPCDSVAGETDAEIGADLCRRVHEFLVGLGLTGVEVVWEREDGLGQVVLAGDGWTLAMRLERRDGMIVWDLE